MKYILILISLGLALAITNSNALAQIPADAQKVEKTVCRTALGHNDADELKQFLVSEAKREAVAELFGEFLTSHTEVDNFVLTQDTIIAASTGIVRVDGSAEYINHPASFAEVCVSITAYVTVDDIKNLRPVELSHEKCLSNDSLTIQQLEKTTKDQAVIEAVLNFEPILENQNPQSILSLMKNKTYVGGFESRTGAYCTTVTGTILPIEVQALLGNSPSAELGEESSADVNKTTSTPTTTSMPQPTSTPTTTSMPQPTSTPTTTSMPQPTSTPTTLNIPQPTNTLFVATSTSQRTNTPFLTINTPESTNTPIVATNTPNPPSAEVQSVFEQTTGDITFKLDVIENQGSEVVVWIVIDNHVGEFETALCNLDDRGHYCVLVDDKGNSGLIRGLMIQNQRRNRTWTYVTIPGNTPYRFGVIFSAADVTMASLLKIVITGKSVEWYDVPVPYQAPK